MSYNIYWLRNDLRLSDNVALKKACDESKELAVVYLLPENYSDLGDFRKTFLHQSLSSLSNDLSKKGLKLYISNRGEFISHLESKVLVPEKTYFSESYNFKSMQDEEKIRRHCQVDSISQCLLFSDYPFEVSSMPKTFTKYRKLVEKDGRLKRESISIESWPKNKDLKFETLNMWLIDKNKIKVNKNFKGGEKEAYKRLRYYLWESRCVDSYKETRNGMLNFDDSSKLSPWLSLGCISSAQIDKELQSYESDFGANNSTYWLYFEILWRDYFKLLGLSQKKDLFKISGSQNKEIKTVANQKELFSLWCKGQTESDFVNANMIELKETGWMSNRGRQNVASYLAKTLEVDWTWGASWFEKHLIDYDAESNWGNWAYLAGISVDPRDRKFNVERQASIYDADKSYRNKFLNYQGNFVPSQE